MLNNQTISFPFGPADMCMLIEYTGNYPLYVGFAPPGALSSEAKWQIKKLTYDANYNVTSVQFASGANDYNKVWDSRASYTYS